MANKSKTDPETSISHKASGATGSTITMTSKANATGQQSTSFDRGAVFSPWENLLWQTKWGTGPADNAPMYLYIAWSDDNSNFAGGLTSTDATFTDLVTNGKLDLVAIFRAKNNTTAQQQHFRYPVRSRYGLWVWYNASAQTLSGTAGDHVLITTPVPDELQ